MIFPLLLITILPYFKSTITGFEGVKGEENLKTEGSKLLGIKPINSNSTTPNFLFNGVKSVIDKNPALGKVLKQNSSAAQTDFIKGLKETINWYEKSPL